MLHDCVLHTPPDLFAEAPKAAAGGRGSLTGAVWPGRCSTCDHGAVHTSKDYTRLCALLGVTQSKGAVATSADNALAEAFNATLKREVLQDAHCWPDEATRRREVFAWLVRYNTRRRHCWCGYQSPIRFETTLAATTLLSAAQCHPVSQDRGKALVCIAKAGDPDGARATPDFGASGSSTRLPGGHSCG